MKVKYLGESVKGRLKDGDFYEVEKKDCHGCVVTNSDGYSVRISNGEFLIIEEEPETPEHYDNSQGSLYQFAEQHNLNSYEFDIIKRVIRCRKKGEFLSDLNKTKNVIDIYIKEQTKM